MTVALAFGVTAAIAAAVLYSVGVTLQAIEARQSPSDQSLKPSLLRGLLRNRRWLCGTGCVAGGWIMQAGALLLAPVTVVQPALAVSVVALLVIGSRFFGESVRSREILAAAAIVVGVAGLVAVSPAQSEDHAAPIALAIGMTVLGLVAVAPFALHRRGVDLGVFVAVSAGVAYAWTGFSTKFVADGLSSGAWLAVALWLAATVAAALIGLLIEMTALQARPAVRVFPIVIVVQIVIAVLLAPLLAGEKWAPDPLIIAGLAASVIVVALATRALASSKAIEQVIATD